MRRAMVINRRNTNLRGFTRCRIFSRGAAEGFTLLEVMLAMTILALALLAVYQSQRQSLAMADRANFLTEAALLAQGRMARIDAMSLAELSGGTGDFGEEQPEYRWELVVLDTEIPFFKRIELTVTRKKPSADRYQVVLYKVMKI